MVPFWYVFCRRGKQGGRKGKKAKRGLNRSFKRNTETMRYGRNTGKILLASFDVEHTGYGCWKSGLLQLGAVAATIEPARAQEGAAITAIDWKFQANCFLEPGFSLSNYVPDSVRTKFTPELVATGTPVKDVLTNFFSELGSLRTSTGTPHAFRTMT